MPPPITGVKEKNWLSKSGTRSDVGIATHYVPSKVIPDLKTSLSAVEDATLDKIDQIIEAYFPPNIEVVPPTTLRSSVRSALDQAFSKPTVEGIIASLHEIAQNGPEAAATWATSTLQELHLRSPTSLKVALQAVRLGKSMTLAQVLQMEMDLATAFIVRLITT